MRHARIHLYASPPAEPRLEELVEHLASWGYHTVHPERGVLLEVSEGGEPVDSSLQQIKRKLIEEKEIRWDFYLYDSLNVYTHICTTPTIVKTSLHGGALNEEEIRKLVHCCESLFKGSAQTGAMRAFVFDRFAGNRQDFHWDDFVLGDVTPVDHWAEVLGLHAQSGKLRLIPKDAYTCEEGPGFYLFRRRTELSGVSHALGPQKPSES